MLDYAWTQQMYNMMSRNATWNQRVRAKILKMSKMQKVCKTLRDEFENLTQISQIITRRQPQNIDAIAYFYS